MPHYSKVSNLINYINRAEIVKYFTNFACGSGGGKIKFCFIKQAFSLLVRTGV